MQLENEPWQIFWGDTIVMWKGEFTVNLCDIKSAEKPAGLDSYDESSRETIHGRGDDRDKKEIFSEGGLIKGSQGFSRRRKRRRVLQADGSGLHVSTL